VSRSHAALQPLCSLQRSKRGADKIPALNSRRGGVWQKGSGARHGDGSRGAALLAAAFRASRRTDACPSGPVPLPASPGQYLRGCSVAWCRRGYPPAWQRVGHHATARQRSAVHVVPATLPEPAKLSARYPPATCDPALRLTCAARPSPRPRTSATPPQRRSRASEQAATKQGQAPHSTMADFSLLTNTMQRMRDVATPVHGLNGNVDADGEIVSSLPLRRARTRVLHRSCATWQIHPPPPSSACQKAWHVCRTCAALCLVGGQLRSRLCAACSAGHAQPKHAPRSLAPPPRAPHTPRHATHTVCSRGRGRAHATAAFVLNARSQIKR